MAAKQEAPRTTNRLARVVSGKLDKPVRVVLYGLPGLGKTTFASKAPRPIFFGLEDGTAQLDVERMPDVNTWRDMLDALAELEAADHPYQTVVVDTADALEPRIWAAMCAADGKKNIEAYGFGKGYQNALDEWEKLTQAFDRLRDARGMNVIVIAHSHTKAFRNPEGDDFDRYEMKLNKLAGAHLREWADAALFTRHETLTHKENERARAKGISTGARIIHTEYAAAFDAKNRYDLPPTLPLDWDAFYAAVRAHRPADPSRLDARIGDLLKGMPEDVVSAVSKAMTKANGDAAELARITNKLMAMKSIATNDQINTSQE